MSIFCLTILVGISTSWVIFLTSFKFTLKRKLATRVKLFYFEIAGMAFKSVDSIYFGNLAMYCIETIYNTVQKRKGFYNLDFFWHNFYIEYHFLSFSVFFQWNLVLLFFLTATLLGCLKANFGHCRGGSLTNSILITVLVPWFGPKVTGSLKTRLGPKAWPSA